MSVANKPPEDGLHGPLLPADGGAPPRLLWTATLHVSTFGIGIVLAMLGPTLIGLAEQMGVSFATASTLFTARAFGYLAGALVCGELLDRLRNQAVVFLMPCLCACAGALVLPSVRSYSLACVLFFTQGLTMGFIDTGGNVLLLTLWRGSDQLNRHMHALHFFFGLGCVLAPAAVASCVKSSLRAVAAWTVAGLGLSAGTAGYLLLAFQAQPKPAPEALGEGSMNRVVLLTGAFLGVYVGAEVTFGGCIDAFAVRWLGTPEADAAWLTSVYWGMLTVGRLVAAVVTPYVHHARYLAWHVLLALLAVGVLAVVSEDLRGAAAPGSTSWWAFVVAPSALEGFALAPLFPGAMLVAEELSGKPITGRASSIIVTSAAAGEMCFPLLAGALMELRATYFPWCQLLLCSAASALFLANSARLLTVWRPGPSKH